MATELHHGSVGGACNDQTPISSLLSPHTTKEDSPHFDFTERLPDVTSSEAPATAATKLQLLLQCLERGEVPVTIIDLRTTLSYAVKVLTACSAQNSYERRYSDSLASLEPLSAVRDGIVRDWLSATFTRQRRCSQLSPRDKLPTFKNVAKTLMIGKYIENIYKDRVQVKPLHYPEGVHKLFQTLDSWNFAIFEAETLTTHQPLRYIGHELFKRHNLFTEHKISPATLDAFLMEVEKGYKSHQNSYHNKTHGADVLQTVHALVLSSKLDQFWLSSLELLALLIAAAVHDVDHPGTTNAFQIKTQSDFALCYNDRSVLENHHLQYAFNILKNEEKNILRCLNPDDFAEVRGLVIDMVLATDMSSHFEQLKQMRTLLSEPDSVSQLSDEHRSKALCLLVHTADISHPGKPWLAHLQWTERITDEFFRQGDWERELALPLSPLCDRNATPLAESRMSFIDYIVSPLFDLCGDTMDLLGLPSPTHSRPWRDNLTHNRERWTSMDNHAEESTGARRYNLSRCNLHFSHKHSTGMVNTAEGNSSDSTPHSLQNGQSH